MFVAIVGPSGAGKDTVIRAVAEALRDRSGITFVRRVITRLSDGVTEDHDTMTPDAFEAGRAAGMFCLSWGAHGLFYGLPLSALDAVGQGNVVVANVSRSVLAEAVKTFGRVAVVEITADPEILLGRILARGRESAEEARRRIARSADTNLPHATCSYVQIDNSGPVEIARDQLTKVLSASILSDLEREPPLRA
ncbi:phosphonate metabolism protein/1,5-bisphosphokinase (PRPP-forming) PhnN [Microvirga lotononidis]|uniref:Ribose 1,5-bisphosphate phosphokinase PhnN n=1 Tax=Microvirga lotononidis TaxID=864069 RepID=I4YSU9_9HYPH|nr:phosphonate metabolism protein/1,5-bisphosphokinase (PRPP-forming) PhnN [Microvirga lotononidis]EIM27041.1 phosphonate metabolism protein, PRPP-forming 1,5-bisphosphokinase PhnN [Microvirga lotononidis]WQO28769.1 phosphonate metabolism protein/1,5-bisphosphokinase (PRPP-forming) PhnN [Microvirga lotononidis]